MAKQATFGIGLFLMALVLILCSVHLVATQRRANAGHTKVDLKTFYVAGAAAAHSRNIYKVHLKSKAYPYIYPPLLASLIRPLILLPLRQAILVWNLLQLFLIVVGFELLRRLLATFDTPMPVLLAAAIIFIHSWSLVENITWVQINLWVWVAMLGSLLLLRRNRPWSSGGLLAVAASIKLVPVLLLLLLPLMDWRNAAKWIGGFAIGVVASLLLVPALVGGLSWAIDMNAAFVSLLVENARNTKHSLPWGENCANHSLLFGLKHIMGKCANPPSTGHAARIRSIYGVLRGIMVTGTTVTTLLSGWVHVSLIRSRRRSRGHEAKSDAEQVTSVLWLLTVAQTILVMLLVTPISWIHQWVLVLIPLAALAVLALGPNFATDDHPTLLLPKHMRTATMALAIYLAAVTIAGHEMESYRVGTVAFAWYAGWIAITGLLATVQASILLGDRIWTVAHRRDLMDANSSWNEGGRAQRGDVKKPEIEAPPRQAGRIAAGRVARSTAQ